MINKILQTNQVFLLPKQPKLDDKRKRNSFGILKSFGKTYKMYYDAKDKATERHVK